MLDLETLSPVTSPRDKHSLMAAALTAVTNQLELRGTQGHEPGSIPLAARGCQHLKRCLGIGAIPSVPGAYPGGPVLPSLLPARPLGRALQWGILQRGSRATGLAVRSVW